MEIGEPNARPHVSSLSPLSRAHFLHDLFEQPEVTSQRTVHTRPMPVNAAQGCSIHREYRLLYGHIWTLQRYLRQTVWYTAKMTKANFTYDNLHRAFQGKEPCTKRILS